jgi:hypothetical protein
LPVAVAMAAPATTREETVTAFILMSGWGIGGDQN